MSRWKVSADTGGTFTDCLIQAPDGRIERAKVLSSGRLRTRILRVASNGWLVTGPLPPRAAGWLPRKRAWISGQLAGEIIDAQDGRIRLDSSPGPSTEGAILEIDSGWEAPILAMHLHLPASLLEDKEELAFRLGTTKGTNALLENKGAPTALFLTRGFEDLLLIRDQKRPDLFARQIQRPDPIYQAVFGVNGRISTNGEVLQELDRESLLEAARKARREGCETAAVCLLNAWRNPVHEREAEQLLRQEGFSTVRISSSIRSLIKYLDRADTTLVDATLSPVLGDYLDRVEEALHGNELWVMTSAAGLVSRERFHAVDSLVSGPAGGVLGAVMAGKSAGMNELITLDMGGTSTDVSRWKAGNELRHQIEVGRARILTPAMPIETVAAGGGSICGYDGERLFVGPDSAGADPGPASYGAGGPLTLTDIHLLLGRVDPDAFSIPINLDQARAALREVAESSGDEDWRGLAEGFLVIATERMAQAIRQVTLREGEDPKAYNLVAFGGAGGLHACRVSELLGIRKILLPADAGLLSAKGIHYAFREAVVERQILQPLHEASRDLEHIFKELQREALQQLKRDGVAHEQTGSPKRTLFIRMTGQENTIPVHWESQTDLQQAYRMAFEAIFGYFPEDPQLEIVKARLRLAESGEGLDTENFILSGAKASPVREMEGVSRGRKCRIPVFEREDLPPGMRISGPAIVSDPFGTCFVEEGWEGIRGDAGSVLLSFLEEAEEEEEEAAALENVERTLVLNRLEGLVEEMGEQLRQTALSTNIRERLDFSCALLDGKGRLIVNAPHIPVHLGAMGICVRKCTEYLDPGLGDVIITNHPAYGGSHLPDVTLIRGLFDREGNRLGFIANRAHHAEWGGKSPGSMPADARSLNEEGVIIEPQWLVRHGRPLLDQIEKLLREAEYPSRTVAENRIDLEAQLASLRRGEQLFQSLLGDYGPSKVTAYLREFYRLGSECLRAKLANINPAEINVEELLDDGHSIKVGVRQKDGAGLEIDFEGTDGQHPGNLNATPAIVRSAVLYVLRLLVGVPMPLNEGLLDEVEIRLPRCFLNPEFPDDPSSCPAVVGGNVETSQRVVDALIRAFDLMAGSQGTMNNLLFGNDRFGYYETIGGGSGAGDGFDGASGVHVHMTNTAITDPEILEHRYPVSCREFSIRKGSGGAGRFRGGDGLVRELVYLEPVSVSLLSQRRKSGAAGCHGGKDGLPGKQWLIRADGSRMELSGISQTRLGKGEGIRIETPGGGGWGCPGR